MRRRTKPAKAKVENKRPPARKGPKTDDARVRDLEKRLAKALEGKAEALEQLETRDRELTEALEQRTATAEILRIIASPPADLQPVLDAMAESAARLCASHDASIFRLDGNVLRLAAHHGPLRGSPGLEIPAIRGTVTGRAVVDRQTIQVVDLQAAVDEFPESTKFAREFGFRTYASVPLLREGVAIGAIGLRRTESEPFTNTQIALMQAFADQAVIAIENARLFNETKEALERQTATGEILRVISSSPTDVQPVFETIAATALRLCNAKLCTVFRFDGQLIHLVALHQVSTEGAVAYRDAYPAAPGRAGGTHRAILTGSVVHIRDIREDPEYELQALARANDFGCVLSVPMLRQGLPIGAVTVGREAGRAFPDEQIKLLKTFAAQAVIAIENARLLKELEERTHELTRSVEQLTALGEVGRAVSSTLDLETVLTTIVSRAVELSELDGGVVFEYDEGGDEFVHRVGTGTGGALAEVRRATRVRKGEGVVGQTAITLEPAQVPDITVPGAYESRLRENLITSGVRAVLAVPMLSENRLVGCLVVSRNQAGDFPVETIELLRTFATQSALAIQNARLFREIEDKSRQLEAASRHKSEFLANMSHELRTPLNAVIGFSEVLLQRMFGELNEKQDEYLKDIYASGQHLLSLVNDILDLSKVEAGRMELSPAPFHLPSALDNAVILVKERAARHGITLQVHVDPELGEIVADERKVKQVLLNLLSNAVKFTPEGGRISLKASSTGGVVEIAVTDTGVGIAPEDQAAIFEEFRQVGSDETRKQEGTGLGLTLAKKFVELHGGRIWVESDPGRGSTFTFTLPVG